MRRWAPSPGAPPFVDVGDRVVIEQQIGVVESMKLFLPVPSPITGTVVAVLREDGTAVGRGEPVAVVEP